jgi:replicative DNA helicase
LSQNDLKQLPFSEEAEKAVIGAMLIDSSAIGEVILELSESSFFIDKHRFIFATLSHLSNASISIDYVSVIDHLNSKGLLDRVKKEYIVELGDFVPSSANVMHYARIVKEKELARSLINTCNALISDAYSETEEVKTLLDKAETSIFSIAENNQTKSYEIIKPILFRAMDHLENLHRSGSDITGVSTGFKDLDKLTAGWQNSDLIILAGRPSMGKTAAVLNFARNAAFAFLKEAKEEQKKREGTPDTSAVEPKSVAFFSLEMGADQLVQRLLTMESMIDGSKIRTGNLAQEDWVKLSNSVGGLSDLPLYIDDSPGLNVVELRAKARRLKAEKNMQFLIVDYLQLMSGGGREESRQQEISAISRNLKLLAKELNIPIIALSQLSRAVESRTDKRPQLSDLRESGSIEQDADIVGFVHRPEYYRIDQFPDDGTAFAGMSTEGMAEIIIGKQRNGALGDVRLRFLKNFGRFVETDLVHSPETHVPVNDPGF